MRELRSFDKPAPAEALAHTLSLAGIDNDLRDSEGRHIVWILDHDQLDDARRVSEQFDENNYNLRDLSAARKKKQAAEREAQRNSGHREISVRSQWSSAGQVSLLSVPITVALLTLCVIVGIYSMTSADGPALLDSLYITPSVPGRPGYSYVHIQWQEFWRIWTPLFIHHGPIHLLFNMMFLYRLGPQVERNHGVLAYLALVIVVGGISNYTDYSLTGQRGLGGMSGVLYGLFGFVWMQQRFAGRSDYVLQRSTPVILVAWLFVCASGLLGPIANVAHSVGLLVGLALASPAYFRARREGRLPKTNFAQGSWADQNLHGFDRLRRQFFDPYVPLWLAFCAVITALPDVLR